jgi:hypothetical protein
LATIATSGNSARKARVSQGDRLNGLKRLVEG